MEKIELNGTGFAETAGFIHVYHADPDTGEFVRESDEYLSVGVGIPANGYIDEPLLPQVGYAICRGADGWEYVEDWRGVDVYSTDAGKKVTITVPCSLPDGVTVLKPETSYDFWDDGKWVTDEGAKQQAEITDAESKKAQLFSEADKIIERLKDAIELDMATKSESALYTAWRKYRVLLNRVDTSETDIEWPEKPK